MSSDEHDVVVQESFTRQVGLFSGPDSPFAVRTDDALAWLEPLAADMIVLDVACGAAQLTEAVAAHVRQAVGIDLTPTLLELGAIRLTANRVSNVLLQEGNAASLPFTDRSFDLVYCRATLHHLADPVQSVAEMVRTCRPGGRVVLSDLVAPSAEERDAFDRLHRLIDPSHRRAFLADELVDLLAPYSTPSERERPAIRLPLEVVLTDQSDRDQVVAILQREMSGGESTGFDPSQNDGTIVVTFPTCSVEALVRAADA